MESIRLTLPLLNKDQSGRGCTNTGNQFPNQLTAVVNFNCEKGVEIIALFDTAWWRFDFSLCISLTFFYNYHKLDPYGQKIAFTS